MLWHFFFFFFGVHLIWSVLSLDIYIHVFHQIWEVFSLYFFNYSLCSFLCLFFWNFCVSCIDLLDGVIVSLGYVHISSTVFFFLFLRLDHFHCPIFNLTDSSSSNLPLNPFSFYFSYCIFSSRIYFLFLFSFFLLLSWYFHFVHTFFKKFLCILF